MDTWCGLQSCHIGALTYAYQTLIAGILALASAVTVVGIERCRRQQAARDQNKRSEALAKLLNARILLCARHLIDKKLRMERGFDDFLRVRVLRQAAREVADELLEEFEATVSEIWQTASQLKPNDMEEVIGIGSTLQAAAADFKHIISLLDDSLLEELDPAPAALAERMLWSYGNAFNKLKREFSLSSPMDVILADYSTRWATTERGQEPS
ncbi:MAG: hypothetical protein E6Q98_19940 [Rhodospirillaceae bacterium]|nr:MAG: hypothetical protein E6Q98_19940 [Rhodospirillaceae bacterium]